jgi:hypothetical protein
MRRQKASCHFFLVDSDHPEYYIIDALTGSLLFDKSHIEFDIEYASNDVVNHTPKAQRSCSRTNELSPVRAADHTRAR